MKRSGPAAARHPREPRLRAVRRSRPTSAPRRRKGPVFKGGGGHPDHLYNFIEAVRTRKEPLANAEVAHLSCGLVHLGEIGYRVGRVLHFDPKTEQFRNDAEAHALLTKKYRAPWGVPDPV